jgi:hypothetical protein
LFIKISDNGWEDEELYARYAEAAYKYLGGFAEDRLEQSRLVVCLARMKSGRLNLDYTEKIGV